jgi:hypothetical protein
MMSNRRFLVLVTAAMAVLFVLLIMERAACVKADGSACKFGSRGISVPGALPGKMPTM